MELTIKEKIQYIEEQIKDLQKAKSDLLKINGKAEKNKMTILDALKSDDIYDVRVTHGYKLRWMSRSVYEAVEILIGE